MASGRHGDDPLSAALRDAVSNGTSIDTVMTRSELAAHAAPPPIRPPQRVGRLWRHHRRTAGNWAAVESPRRAPAHPAVLALPRNRRMASARLSRALKRALDVLIAAVALVALALPLTVIAILVKLTSPGPTLYRQRRIGMGGKPFTILKFRSMHRDAERSTGPIWAQPDDPRATPLGRRLRRWHLDELPQLWNVLRGDMSIVGPRPERPYFVARFRDRVPRYMLRHAAPPGLTGWAQVHGWRGNTAIEQRVAYDLDYIANRSLALDVKIIGLTVLGLLADRHGR